MTRYPDAAAFRMALERRIANDAKNDPQITSWYRKRVAFDRTIARLEHLAPGAFTLKGGLALVYRFGPGARRTMDMDFAAHDAGRMRDVLQALPDARIDDFFDARVAREPNRPLIQEAGVAAYRWSVETRLDGKFFERIAIDVGIGDPTLDSGTQRITTQPILAFAGIAPTEINVIPLEQHIARNCTRTCKIAATASTRGSRTSSTCRSSRA